MNEQLRTEAEKVLKQAYNKNVKPLMSNMPTFEESNSLGGYDWIINAMLDFHAQQSKESEWISVTEKYPDEKQTVWCYSEKLDNVFLGEYVYVMNEGWFWAESSGVIYASDGKIVTECEMDDFDVSHWFPTPLLPNKSTLTK